MLTRTWPPLRNTDTPRDVPSANPVMFAFLVDTRAQREAWQDEVMYRLGAIQLLSETVATAKLESPDPESHSGILEAVAILSRDVRGLMRARIEARF